MEKALGVGSRIKHPMYGIGAVIKATPLVYHVTFMQHGNIEIPTNEEIEIIERINAPIDMVSLRDVEEVLGDLLQKWGGTQEIVQLGDKWEGGKLILQPANNDLKPKEMPISKFFHKIVMVRDRIRVMEQRINASKLTDSEKVSLQQYITRIYGSLTSFNVLFKYKSDSFKGSSK